MISGYLMAALIGRELSTGHFSLAGFYERRARRILPALFGVLLFCSLAASVLITPKLLSDFGATLVAAVLFASNLVFWRKTANYFDASTDWNPLVHTWSLGVEEQFYILFPLLLMLVWRYGQSARLSSIALASLGSLALSIWGTANAPTATFYLLPTRAWELLIGALPALWAIAPNSNAFLERMPPLVRRAGSVVGLLLIMGSLLWFDGEMAFPGAAALLPCVGTSLLLTFGSDSLSPVTRLLSLPPLRFIGKISYSLYLWHWPLLVFAEKYTSFGAFGRAGRVLVVAVAFVAAYASWRWIEQPFRARGTAFGSRRIFAAAVTGGVAFSVAGMFAVASNGWPQRFPGIETVSLLRQELASVDPDWQRFDDSKCFVAQPARWHEQSCFLTRSSATTTLLWGDSFAASYAYGLFRNAHSNSSILQYTSPGCPPVVSYDAAARPLCARFNSKIAAIVRNNHISTVIMAANWSTYIKRRKLQYAQIGDTTAFLRSLHVRVVLVGQSPVFGFAYPDEYFFATFGPEMDARAYYAPLAVDPGMNRTIAAIAGANVDVFFDPLQLLCHESACLFKRGASYLVSDFGHLSLYGSRLVANALLDATEGLDQRSLPRSAKTVTTIRSGGDL